MKISTPKQNESIYRSLIVSALLVLSITFSGISQLISHLPSGSSGNWRINSFAQSFTIPPASGCTSIDQLNIVMSNISANNGFSAQFSILSGNGTGGSTIYGSQAVTVNTGINTFNFPAVTVTPGSVYTYMFTFTTAADGGAYVYVQNVGSAITDSYTGGAAYNNGNLTNTNVATYDDLFEIYCASTALPVEFTNFSARKTDRRTAELTWTTVTEMNNDHFTIERSTNGSHWEALAQIDGAGFSYAPINYTFNDYGNQQNTSYYRIKQTDFDGAISYSEIRIVDFGHSEQDALLVYPSPTEKCLQLRGEHLQTEELRFTDSQGTDIRSHLRIDASTSQNVLIDVSELTPGIYFVVYNGTIYRFVKK